MNCLALEQDDGIVIVDCGITFPTTDLGVDVYHPRFDYLLARRDRLKGVLITHGHEDHIGALPYLLRAVDVPVYGPGHALELAKGRLAEHGFDLAALDLRVVAAGDRFKVGPFGVEPIRVTHSITEATALALRTGSRSAPSASSPSASPTPSPRPPRSPSAPRRAPSCTRAISSSTPRPPTAS
jgi:ribonuclease J